VIKFKLGWEPAARVVYLEGVLVAPSVCCQTKTQLHRARNLQQNMGGCEDESHKIPFNMYLMIPRWLYGIITYRVRKETWVEIHLPMLFVRADEVVLLEGSLENREPGRVSVDIPSASWPESTLSDSNSSTWNEILS